MDLLSILKISFNYIVIIHASLRKVKLVLTVIIILIPASFTTLDAPPQYCPATFSLAFLLTFLHPVCPEIFI